MPTAKSLPFGKARRVTTRETEAARKAVGLDSPEPEGTDLGQAGGQTPRRRVLVDLEGDGDAEGFVPIDEGKSKFNTRKTPFDLYDAGTETGAHLGNVIKGDGPRFKGRGYVQLTGPDNYHGWHRDRASI